MGRSPILESLQSVHSLERWHSLPREATYQELLFNNKIMKKRYFLALAIGLTLPSLSFAQILVESYNDNWALTFATNLGGSGATGTTISQQTDSLTLSNYTGLLDLTRVVITITKPLAPNSPDFTSELGNVGGTGTNTFNSASFSSTTDIGTTGAFTAIVSNGGPVLSTTVGYSGTDSATPAPFTIATTAKKSFGVAPQGTTVYFDSSINGSMTTAQLNAAFRDGSTSFLFPIVAKVAADYNRSTSDAFEFVTAGIDSGSIQIDYYAIPEPSSLALLGLSAAGMLFWTRRRPVRSQA